MKDFFDYKFVTQHLELLHSGYARLDKNWKGKAVRSQYSRLYFIKKGSFYVIGNDGERIDFVEGGIYLIPSGYSYVYGCDGINEQYYFHIRLFGFDNIDLLGRFKKPVFCRTYTDFDKFFEMMSSMSMTSSLFIKSEIYSTISNLAYSSNGLLDSAIYSNDVNSVINYVSTYLSAGITVFEIANAINMAKSTISAKFKREVGMSIGEYVDYIVILTSARMLITEKKTISEISDLLGFCDQFYFSRRFKARYGVSPQKFRKNYNYI